MIVVNQDPIALAKIAVIETDIGDLDDLDTTDKTDIVSAINEVNGSVGDIETLFTDTNDPSGFVFPNDIVITLDTTTRTITLSGDLSYYFKGVRKQLTSPWVSDSYPDTLGQYFLYSVNGDTFTWSSTPWSFQNIQVAFLKNVGANSFAIRECHGTMPYPTHEVIHNTIGTFRKSGGIATAGTYTLTSADDADTRPGFDEAKVIDEDITTTIPALPSGSYTTLYIGPSFTATFETDSPYPFRNQTGSYIFTNNPFTGANVVGLHNRYVNVYQILIPVTADTNSQKYRMVFLQPQAVYTSLASAQAENVSSLSLGDFNTIAPEMVFFARITYHTRSNHNNIGKARIESITYITGSRVNQASVIGQTNQAENIIFTSTPTLLSTNVQAVIEEVDTKFDTHTHDIADVITTETEAIPYSNGTALTQSSDFTYDATNKTLMVSGSGAERNRKKKSRISKHGYGHE